MHLCRTMHLQTRSPPGSSVTQKRRARTWTELTQYETPHSIQVAVPRMHVSWNEQLPSLVLCRTFRSAMTCCLTWSILIECDKVPGILRCGSTRYVRHTTFRSLEACPVDIAPESSGTVIYYCAMCFHQRIDYLRGLAVFWLVQCVPCSQSVSHSRSTSSARM
jgi:hypothetical protein